jgi:hypothetical protein
LLASESKINLIVHKIVKSKLQKFDIIDVEDEDELKSKRRPPLASETGANVIKKLRP